MFLTSSRVCNSFIFSFWQWRWLWSMDCAGDWCLCRYDKSSDPAAWCIQVSAGACIEPLWSLWGSVGHRSPLAWSQFQDQDLRNYSSLKKVPSKTPPLWSHLCCLCVMEKRIWPLTSCCQASSPLIHPHGQEFDNGRVASVSFLVSWNVAYRTWPLFAAPDPLSGSLESFPFWGG